MGWLARFLSGENYYLPGLDIGTYSLKLVHLNKSKGNYKLALKSEYVYKEQVFAGTEIIDVILLSSYIKELLKSNDLNEQQVAIHVPLTSCFYNVISVPSSKNPEEAVMNYVQNIVTPEEISQVKIDYRVLPVSIGKDSTDIAITAVKKDFLEERVRAVSQAGLTPVIIDVEPAVINNQFYLNYPESTASPVCLVDIGATFTKVIVSFGGYPYITRNVEYGGYSITEQLQKEYMLSLKDAEELKRGNDIKDTSYKEAFNTVIVKSIKNIVTEVLWTIDNFKDRFNLDVDKIYLYGGSSKLKGLAEEVKKLTEKEVYMGAPLKFATIADNEEFAVSVGLSLRYKGDSNVKV